MEDIKGFFGQYRFLSNFWPAEVSYQDWKYPTVEHAYQAAKTSDLDQRKVIQLSQSAAIAKSLGKAVTLRAGWDTAKLGIMYNLVHQKFSNHPELMIKLKATFPAYLEETNSWHDTFWGVCDGKGRNHLGRILTEIRLLALNGFN